MPGVADGFYSASSWLQTLARVFDHFTQSLYDLVPQLFLEFPQFGHEHESTETRSRRGAHGDRGVGREQVKQGVHQIRAAVFPQAVYSAGADLRVLVGKPQAKDAVEVHREIGLGNLHQGVDDVPPPGGTDGRPQLGKQRRLLSPEIREHIQPGG